jgi:hypothetical protein
MRRPAFGKRMARFERFANRNRPRNRSISTGASVRVGTLEPGSGSSPIVGAPRNSWSSAGPGTTRLTASTSPRPNLLLLHQVISPALVYYSISRDRNGASLVTPAICPSRWDESTVRQFRQELLANGVMVTGDNTLSRVAKRSIPFGKPPIAWNR